jgi:hypothetical protein
MTPRRVVAAVSTALLAGLCQCSLIFDVSALRPDDGSDSGTAPGSVDARDGMPSQGEGAGLDAADASAMEFADASAADVSDATAADVSDATAADVTDASASEGAPPNKIALVQQAGSQVQLASKASETFASPIAAGHTVIALGFWYALGYSGTVTDSVGNTYAATVSTSNPQQGVLQIFYAARAAPGATTVTLTTSAPINYMGLAIFEYAGLAGSNVLEGSAGHGATSSTVSASTPPLTTSAASSLLFAAFADPNGSGAITPGAGWSPLVTNGQFAMLAEARIVSTSGPLSATATLSKADSRWVALIAAFQRGL